jgi:hypothetical protein
MYIADQNYNCIRKVNTSGIISTFAGDTAAGYAGDGGPAAAAELKSPTDVKIDKYGNVFIADLENNRVRKVNTSGIISTIAGNGVAGFSGDGGPAIAAELSSPNEVVLDASGNLYISDLDDKRIREVKGIVGIDEINSVNKSISVYPNPSNGVFTIQVKSEELRTKNTIEVYNVLGEKVYSQSSIPNPQFVINLKGQPAGIYFVRVYNEGQKFIATTKVVIE